MGTKNLDSYRFCVHIAARRTGKSYAAAILPLLFLEPGQQVMVVAPNFHLINYLGLCNRLN